MTNTVTWRELLDETGGALDAAPVEVAPGEARWLIAEASGLDGADLVLGLDQPATTRCVAHLDAMVTRRLAGEPVQYVLGHWAFRNLDLLVDPRVLIPRPETEQVVDAALRLLDEVSLGLPAGQRPTVVDLGTGSGAIALAVATERPGTDVWAIDVSADAVAVARANLAGLGMAGTRVRVVEGSWFEPLPSELAGGVHLVISNPPYIAADEDLAASVRDWEPAGALVSGPSGLEAYRQVCAEVPRWLAPSAALVFEIGASQADPVSRLLEASGLVDLRVLADHGGLDRVVTARVSA